MIKWHPDLPPLVLGEADKIPTGRWYKRDHWTSDKLRMTHPRAKGWRVTLTAEPVVGMNHDGRLRQFEALVAGQDFEVFLVREPANRYDPNAIAVVASSILGGVRQQAPVGYLSRDTSAGLRTAGNLMARAESIQPSAEEYSYNFEIKVLASDSATELPSAPPPPLPLNVLRSLPLPTFDSAPAAKPEMIPFEDGAFEPTLPAKAPPSSWCYPSVIVLILIVALAAIFASLAFIY